MWELRSGYIVLSKADCSPTWSEAAIRQIRCILPDAFFDYEVKAPVYLPSGSPVGPFRHAQRC